jgi:hypothetical protein
MAGKNKSGALVFLFLCSVGTLIIPFIASCGKGASTLPAGSNVQLQILNLSPDLLPVNLWINFNKQGNNIYSYPTPSGYFALGTIDTPIQIRSVSAAVSSVNWASIDTVLRANVKYSIFITGLKADNTITSIFTVDTAIAPTVGRGKVRFINASPRSPGLDVTANGTPAFTNQAYKIVSKFIEVPPGNYEFKITPNGSPSNPLSDLKNITILDGKLYTLYCYGLVGRVDTTAFGSGVIINK